MISTCIIFSIFLILLGLIFKKSNIIFSLQIVWIYILCAFSNGGIDYIENENIYYESGRNSISFGYGWLANFFSYIGHKMEWDYVTYNSILVLVALIVLVFVTKKITEAPCVVMSLFMIYPLIDSIYQKRFFIAMCFCYLAFYYYIKDNISLFFFFIVIAIGFHFSPVIYLFFPLVKKILNYKNRWVSIAVILIEITIFNEIPNILKRLNLYTLRAKFITYSQEQVYSSNIIAMLYFVLQLAFIILIVNIGKRYSFQESDRNEKIIELNINSFILLPLLLLGSTYVRYYRIFMLFNYAMVADRFCINKKRKTYSYIFSVGFVALLTISSLVILFTGAYSIQDKLESIFENNLFIENIMKFSIFT